MFHINRFKLFIKDQEAKLDDRYQFYIESLNSQKLDDAILQFTDYQKFLWLFPGILWGINLLFTIFPFHHWGIYLLFMLSWTFGCIGLILSLLVNRMLINLTTRVNNLNQDERMSEIEFLHRYMLKQVAVTLGGIIALPFTLTIIPYMQFLLDHPSWPGMNRKMIELVVGPGIVNNILILLIPIAISAYMYARLEHDRSVRNMELEEWMRSFEYHNKDLHELLSGESSIPKEERQREAKIILGTSLETDDYVIQTPATRRQNTVIFGPIGAGKTSTTFIPMIKQDIDSYLCYLRDYKKASQDPTWGKKYGLSTKYLNGLIVIDPTNDLCKEVNELALKMGVPREKVIWLDPENKYTPALNLLRGPVEKAAENVANVIAGLKDNNKDFFAQSERTHLKNMVYLAKLTAVMDNSIASFGELMEMYSDIELTWKKVELLDQYCSLLKKRVNEAQKAYEADLDDAELKSTYLELKDKYTVAWQTSQWFHKNIQVQMQGKNIVFYGSGDHEGEPVHYDVQAEFVHGLINTLDDISKNLPIRRVLYRDSGDFNLDDFLANGGILLCSTAKAVIGDNLAERLGQVYTLSFQAATFRRAPNCTPMLPLYADEFPDYLSESFQNYAAQARKYNVPIVIAAQSPAQLSYKYGDDYLNTLMSVMLTRMTFGDLGPRDAKLLEALFGEHTETTESTNEQVLDLMGGKDSNRQMMATRRETVPNITASQIMSLEKFTVAVRTPGQHASAMFNRIRTQRITDDIIKNDPYRFDLNNKDDREAFDYIQQFQVHDNPDFDQIDKEILEEVQAAKNKELDTSEEKGTVTTNVEAEEGAPTSQDSSAAGNNIESTVSGTNDETGKINPFAADDEIGTRDDTIDATVTTIDPTEDDANVSSNLSSVGANQKNSHTATSNNPLLNPTDAARKTSAVRNKEALSNAVQSAARSGNKTFANNSTFKMAAKPKTGPMTTTNIRSTSPNTNQINEDKSMLYMDKDNKLQEEPKDRFIQEIEHKDQASLMNKKIKEQGLKELRSSCDEILGSSTIDIFDKTQALLSLKQSQFKKLRTIGFSDAEATQAVDQIVQPGIDELKKLSNQLNTSFGSDETLSSAKFKINEVTKLDGFMDNLMSKIEDMPTTRPKDD